MSYNQNQPASPMIIEALVWKINFLINFLFLSKQTVQFYDFFSLQTYVKAICLNLFRI